MKERNLAIMKKNKILQYMITNIRNKAVLNNHIKISYKTVALMKVILGSIKIFNFKLIY